MGRTRRVIKLDRICVACGLKVKREGIMSPWLRRFSICSHMFGIGMRNIRESLKLREDMTKEEQNRSGTLFRKPKRSNLLSDEGKFCLVREGGRIGD